MIFLLFILCSFLGFYPLISQAQNKVFVMHWADEINPPAERYVKLALETAKTQKASLIIFELDTYGGRVDNADAIRTMLLQCEIPVYAFINPNAASAGALIAIACDKIYMTEGATIGAATVVTQDGTKASGKYQSYMVEKMRATAEANKRNPEIAAAMVDEKIQIDSSQQKGKVLTLTTERAIKMGYAEGKVENIKDILAQNKIKKYTLEHYQQSLTEQIIAIFLNPFVSGILLLLILGGIYFEFKMPGTAFPLIVALVASALYFTPYYLHGLAQYWELLVFFCGMILLAIEIFVTPGFGVLGLSGLGLMLSGLFLMMIKNDGFDFSNIILMDIYNSLLVIFIGLVGGSIFVATAIPKLLRSRRFKEISLQNVMDRAQGYSSGSLSKNLVGTMGEAYTVLRPSGKVMIEDTLYDATTRGDYIEQGEKVEVIAQEGVSLRVKKAEF